MDYSGFYSGQQTEFNGLEHTLAENFIWHKCFVS